MSRSYSHAQKKRLAGNIQLVKSKRLLVQIYNIIKTDVMERTESEQNDSMEISENTNGMFIFFGSLQDDTYAKLDKLVTEYLEKKKRKESDETETEHKTYRPRFYDEFPSDRDMSPKLRLNNREKSLMKKRAYNKEINAEEEYEIFDVTALGDSDTRGKKGRNVKNGRKTGTKKSRAKK